MVKFLSITYLAVGRIWRFTWWKYSRSKVCDSTTVTFSLEFFVLIGQKNISSFWSPHASPQTHASAFLILILFCYESMSNYSQYCWIDWNSFVLYFKRLYHIHVGVQMFVRPLLATILCIWEIWSLLAKKSVSPHWFWSHLMTRNQRLFGGPFTTLKRLFYLELGWSIRYSSSHELNLYWFAVTLKNGK